MNNLKGDTAVGLLYYICSIGRDSKLLTVDLTKVVCNSIYTPFVSVRDALKVFPDDEHLQNMYDSYYEYISMIFDYLSGNGDEEGDNTPPQLMRSSIYSNHPGDQSIANMGNSIFVKIGVDEELQNGDWTWNIAGNQIQNIEQVGCNDEVSSFCYVGSVMVNGNMPQ